MLHEDVPIKSIKFRKGPRTEPWRTLRRTVRFSDICKRNTINDKKILKNRILTNTKYIPEDQSQATVH